MNKLIGRLGEEIACRYLIQQNYKILERNFATKFAEVDIIAFKNNTLIIVEVKTRKNFDILYASQAVDYKKIRNLKTIALYYINKNNLFDYDIRFDIIECYWEFKKINHIINAF